jgi:hypothetical protein
VPEEQLTCLAPQNAGQEFPWAIEW